MKHLKLANSLSDFQSKQNIQKCNKTHIVAYKRSDEKYNNLVAQYENNPEDCNYVYPKRILVNYKKQLKCTMEYSWYINSSNKVEIAVKITDIDESIDLNDYALFLQSYTLKHRGKYIWERNGRIETPELNTMYTFNEFGATYIYRGQKICERKGIPESDFNIEWKVRPALIHKNSNIYLGERPRDSKYENIVETQEPLIIKCTLDKVKCIE